jgi:hypothetical protein
MAPRDIFASRADNLSVRLALPDTLIMACLPPALLDSLADDFADVLASALEDFLAADLADALVDALAAVLAEVLVAAADFLVVVLACTDDKAKALKIVTKPSQCIHLVIILKFGFNILPFRATKAHAAQADNRWNCSVLAVRKLCNINHLRYLSHLMFSFKCLPYVFVTKRRGSSTKSLILLIKFYFSP